MSYPYGGAPGGYPAGGGYPGQAPYGAYPGGPPGGYQQPPNYPQPQMSMPTLESAMGANYQMQVPGMPQPDMGFSMGGPAQPAYMPAAPQYGGAPSPYQAAPLPQPGYLQQASPYGVPPSQGYPAAQPHGVPPSQGYPAAQPNVMQQGYGLPPSTMAGGYGSAGYAQPPGPATYSPGAPAQPRYSPNPTAPGGYQQAGSVPYQPQQGQYGAPVGYGGGSAPPSSHGMASPAYASSMPQTAPGSQYTQKISEHPSLKPVANFNPENDAAILRKAMKGMGTDERAIIEVLAYRSNDQRMQIKSMYKTCFGKDLINDLRSELGGRFEDAIVSLMMATDDYDAYELRRAMRGMGTDESCLVEILCTRSNQKINDIKAAYKRIYNRNLEQDLVSETSGHFKRLMVSMANAGRMENQAVDMNKARTDATRLQQAGIKQLGTDESTFNAVLASQSLPQLKAVFDEYMKVSGQTLENSIRREMSGNLASGMLTLVKVVQNKPAYFAERLYYSMKGAGTDDNTLIRVVVSRAEIDMVEIKQAFQQAYQKTLAAFLRDDTSGDYRRLMAAIVGEY